MIASIVFPRVSMFTKTKLRKTSRLEGKQNSYHTLSPFYITLGKSKQGHSCNIVMHTYRQQFQNYCPSRQLKIIAYSVDI